MDARGFRKVFEAAAVRHGFEKSGTRWRRAFPETSVTLNLQRSNYSARYSLNIDIWLHKSNSGDDPASKVGNGSGDVFRREPPEISDLFDLETDVTDEERTRRIECAFRDNLVPLVERLSTKAGLLRAGVVEPQEVFLMPHVKELLEKSAANAV